MAKKTTETTIPKVLTYCKDCPNHGEMTYENIYICRVDGSKNHSVLNCKNIGKKPIIAAINTK